MKAEDKAKLYQLFKIASKASSLYTTESFSAPDPSFTDDIETRIEEAESSVPASDKVSGSSAEKPVPPAASEGQTQKATISSVSEKIAACQRCGLFRTRTNTVPGTGIEQPLVLVVGEGPGEEEDLSGKPFVGKAGQLLDKMLMAISLSRDTNCYIANIVKCRPPRNRNPEPEEIQACISFLQAQIHILKPKMILAMGRVALQALTETGAGINLLHGQILNYKGIPLMATYHPSALLRDETLKRPAWEDLKTFRAKLLEIAPDYDK